MAKTKNTGFTGTIEKPKEREKAPYGKMVFVLNNLDESQIQELDAYEAHPPDLWGFLSDCIDKGIDLKISFDNYSKGYQAIATGAWKNFPSVDYAVSGFSRHSADDALFVLWYKVAIVCQFDLSSAAGRENRSKKDRG